MLIALTKILFYYTVQYMYFTVYSTHICPVAAIQSVFAVHAGWALYARHAVNPGKARHSHLAPVPLQSPWALEALRSLLPLGPGQALHAYESLAALGPGWA